MAAKTTIVLADSSDTPESPGTPAAANRTFVPGEMENGNVHTFYETTTGVTAATRSKLTISLTPGNKIVRMKASLALPKAQTVDGVVKVAHVTRGFCEFIFPEDGSRDDRRDCKKLLQNLLTDTTINPMVADLENLY
jgi:hypothetical protein